jgi:hypothetical protein
MDFGLTVTCQLFSLLNIWQRICKFAKLLKGSGGMSGVAYLTHQHKSDLIFTYYAHDCSELGRKFSGK